MWIVNHRRMTYSFEEEPGCEKLDLLRPFRKCFVCGERQNLRVVHTLGMYYHTRYHFHTECLCMVLKEPERYTPYVDRAVEIMDKINESKQRKKEEAEKHKLLCKKARELSHTVCKNA